MRSTALITTIAAALGLGLALGFVADAGLSRQLAEIDVMLLMLGVGCISPGTSCWPCVENRERRGARSVPRKTPSP